MARLLLIEEAPAFGPELMSEIAPIGWHCDRAQWSSFSFESCAQRPADLLVAGIACNQPRSLDFLKWLGEHPVQLPIVAVFPVHPEREPPWQYLDLVDDVILWPSRHQELRYRIARLLPRNRPGMSVVLDRLSGELGLANVVGKNADFRREIEKIPRAAASDCEVLITGETGTGKELCARAIHHLSRRRNMPLIAVDCGALPDQLFENEMFGHARGAFTDAHRAQKGLVAMAEGGTLFLDEVDSLSLSAQMKLLRFLQDHTYRQLGSEQFSRADVRIVAATNLDLERAVKTNAFRRDLYFRINVLHLCMIPLRRRADDIDLLAEHFLDLCCAETGGPRKTISPSALRMLGRLRWPGNVRELYNAIRRAVLLSDGPRLLCQHFFQLEASNLSEVPISFRDARQEALNIFERDYVEQLWRRHGGNITRAAREAKKDRRAFGRLVKRLGLKTGEL
jgi:DNA-binding NtrC family response regulator